MKKLQKPKIIAVLSAKGGVGKSLFSASLARSLTGKGKKVALLDLDFSSPCIPLLLQPKGDVQVDREGFKPPVSEEGIEIFSMGLLSKTETPILLRGAKRAEIVQQIKDDIKWNSPDYLIIDCPPSTSEETLTMLKSLKPDKAVIICQPDKLSLQAVKKTVTMLKHYKIKISGIAENMSHVKCPKCGQEIRLFKESAEQVAKETKTKLLGSIPFLTNTKMDETPEFNKIVEKVM